ncbi:hypothetical protein GCM10025792_13600 [Pseudonocardia tropica]
MKRHASRWRGIGPARPDRVAFVPQNDRGRPAGATPPVPRAVAPLPARQGQCSTCGQVAQVKGGILLPHHSPDRIACRGRRPAWAELVRHRCQDCGTSAGLGARVPADHHTPTGEPCNGTAQLVPTGRRTTYRQPPPTPRVPMRRGKPHPDAAERASRAEKRATLRAEKRVARDAARAARQGSTSRKRVQQLTEEQQGPRIRAAAELDGRYQHPEDLPGGPPHAYRLPQQPTIPPSPFTASAAPVQEIRASTPEPPPLTELVPVQEVPIKAWKAAAAPPHYLSDPFRP